MGRKILSLLLVAMLAISLFAGCAKAPEKEEPKAPEQEEPKATEEEKQEEPKKEATEDFKVGFVTDTGGIDDRSFNQGTWEGIVKYAEEKGWTEGTEYQYIQSNEEADYIPNLSAFGDDNYNLVIAAGFLFEKAMKEVPPQYPNTNFAIIDAIVEQPNVASVTFAEEQGSFLVGVAAAKTTKTKKVGFVGGMDFPLIRHFHAGFAAGVHSVDPSIEIVDQYAGAFDNPGTGQQIASTMYEQGVDVIYHAAGGTGNGVINEAKNRVSNGENVWVIGVDKNQYADGIYDKENNKSVVLTSMMKRVDVAAYNIIEAAQKGEFPGGKVTALTLADDGVGIPKENPNLSDDIIKTINEYKEKIVKGEITVPNNMEDLKAFEENLK
ncbi:BMP family lipoprotein [Paramaledivibacter caminithermalis]|jgi:basic membrane protein A|uniref:Nucleoside-binding protein n=1 Tax=Paramaledivibacter caminithermalis (strain DSM 15212 / CIP 107654 / DViRD3) TaxID=1121301 RepID=A0A1M6R534_PARC5|nr:BMP family ABC transporter substrate-binding protein [Paramaledivibacter caminithermalis]SHK27591.1 nucleoside-binding protein [Paramaledivibacter caminithermalis DSM 15212]